MAKIRIVIVTPETTTLDQMVDEVTLPLFDGEAGVLADHAPMIARLGPGELRIQTDSSTERFYVDGGFAQIDNNVVSVLTGKSMPAGEISLATARKSLDAAENLPKSNPQLMELRDKAIKQATTQIRMAERSS